jgi:hypothetical protein
VLHNDLLMPPAWVVIEPLGEHRNCPGRLVGES